jgi:serine/threonine-protein kinase PpkA
VGSYQANPWGLHDMLGNLWEWTCSEYDGAYGGAESKCVPIDASGARSLRGGSWGSSSEQVRSAYRNSVYPASRQDDVGFRLARD